MDCRHAHNPVCLLQYLRDCKLLDELICGEFVGLS